MVSTKILQAEVDTLCECYSLQEIQESMKRLEKAEYSAGMPFPEDRETQERE